VHLFQLSPCRQYWDNILPERILAIKRKKWRHKLDEFADYFGDGNPLLASMGLAGQEFAKLTAELKPQEIKLYQTPPGTDLLSRIQTDIVDAENRKQGACAVLQHDRSVQFHCCHSPMREIQVLHDRLLDFFATDSELKPADILIMAPDIERYAPLISGVFDSTDKSLHIPWSISDLSRRNGETITEAFSALIQLPGSRYTAPEVMVLLENPAIMAGFEIREEDLASIRTCIADAGARWGLDQQQRRQQDLDDSPLHTWEFAIERLLMGYMTGPLDTPVATILPSAGKLNHSADWLGQLANFFRALQWLERKLNSEPQRPIQWEYTLQLLLKKFFSDADNVGTQPGLRQIRETLLEFNSDCKKAHFNKPLTLAVIRSHILKKLSTPQADQGFLKGNVNFCRMTAMRALPFKIIWLLGMNDTQYPRAQRPPAFDLIEARLALGDRSRRDSDQYLFLETLLSSRQHFCISWLGRHPKTNDEQPPSVVVAELRDYIDSICMNEQNQTASQMLTTEHPLQAFSTRCFNGQPDTASYAAHWLPESLHTEQEVFIRQPLDASVEDTQDLNIRELLRYWTHPVRYFAQQRLGLGLWQDNTQLEEAEAFSLDALSQYQLKQRLLTTFLDEQDSQAVLLHLQATGDLPRAGFGQALYRETEQEARNLVERLAPYHSTPVKAQTIDIPIAGLRLHGHLSSLDQNGQYSFRLAKFKGKDILQLWLRHLLLLLSEASNIQPLSRHFAEDKTICFSQVHEPLAELAPFIEGYQQGMNQPLHFYPQTSYALAKALSGKSPKTAANTALNAWLGTQYNRGEQHDIAYQICFRGLNQASILDANFEQLAGLYQPLLKHMQIS
jgi:exodeoxyribonuclease V gamma subunit